MILATCLALLIACPGWLVVDINNINFDNIQFLNVQKNTFEDEYINDEEEIKPLKTSQAAIDFIKDKEKFRSVAYDDGTGTWTIGWGHTGTASGTKVEKGMYITEEEGEQLLIADLAEFEKNVYNRMVNYNTPMSQREFDYLIIATFNRGNEIVGKELYEAVSKRDRDTLRKLMAKTIEGSDPNVVEGLENRVSDEDEFLFDVTQYIPTTTTLPPLDIPTTTTTTMPGRTTGGYPFNIYTPPKQQKKDESKLDAFLEGMYNIGVNFQDAIDKALGVEKGKPIPKYGYLGEKIKNKLDEWNK